METKRLLVEVIEGRLPRGADAEALNARLVEAEPDSGRIVMQFDGREYPTHALGSVAGGWIASMLDLVASLTAATTYGDGEFGPSLELKVNFLRATPPGRFIGTGRTVNRSRSIAFTEAELRTEQGELIATASSTLRIVRAASASA